MIASWRCRKPRRSSICVRPGPPVGVSRRIVVHRGPKSGSAAGAGGADASAAGLARAPGSPDPSGSLRRARYQTDAGLEIRDVYTGLDSRLGDEAGDSPSATEATGELPLWACRASFPTPAACSPPPYRGRLWTMRQYAGFGSAEESNRRYKYLLQGGQTGLSVAFDLPTQMGHDPDHPLSRGEVGRSASRSPAWPICACCSMGCRSMPSPPR